MLVWKVGLVLCAIVLEFSSAKQQNASNVYSIVAHGKLVPNSVYSVVVHIAGEINETEILAVIYGKTDENDIMSINSSISVQHSGAAVIDLNIANVTDGEYSLNVSAKGGLQFNHHTQLFLESKQLSIFVQTDKAVYKPGQTVRFRIAAFHRNLLAAFSEKVRTEIRDTNGNVIRVFNSKIDETGIASHELQLSEEPVLGNWLISGSIENQRFMKNFEVAEYILPFFDVQINAPSNVKSNKSQIPIEVKAIYTYGKPVKGELQLCIYSMYTYPKQILYSLHSKIKGEKTVAVQMNNLVRKKIYYSTSFEVEVSVKDCLTGKVYNKSHSISIYEDEVVFSILNQNTNFKYGINYVAYIKGADRNDQFKPAEDAPVSVYYGFGYDNYDKKIETKMVDGIIKVIINTKPPAFETVNVTSIDSDTVKVFHYSDNSSISIQVEYNKKNVSAGNLYAERDLEDCFAQLRVENSGILEWKSHSLEIGKQLELIFDTNIPIKEYTYQIISKNGILLNKNEKKAEASKKHTIQVTTTHEMTPKARVVVYFTCNKSIGVDAVEFHVTGALRTKVNISTESLQTKPGSNVSITFDTRTASSVHILGIDQKMLLLKSGNDIEMKHVVSEIEKYVGCDGQIDFESCVRRRWYYWHSKRNVFTSSGLHVFSPFYNETEYEIYPLYRRKFGAMAASLDYAEDYSLTTYAPYTLGANGGGRMAKSYRKTYNTNHFRPAAVKVRQHFPETWLWETLQTKEDGKIIITRTVPDTITSWFISCFAVNNVTGFGLTDEVTTIKVMRKFFVSLNLPYSIIRGETVIIEATVFNYHKKAKNIEITLEKKNEFVFNASEEKNDVWDAKGSQTKSIVVPGNDGVTVSFHITAKQPGFVEIKVTAVGDGLADSVSDKLFVKPEGETTHENHAVLVSVNNNSSVVSKSFKVTIPKNAVNGSQRIWVTVIADILGTAINNVDNLLQVPSGCGEQNMVNFVPNVVVLEYLTKAKKLTKKLKVKALTNIQTGYQRQLTYRHYDGSFSAFGVGDTNGSTWLTAFVVKSFIQAKPYIHIDSDVLNRSVTFLLERQTANGSFVEYGKVIDKAMQSGTADGTASLTAYVLIALTLNQSVNAEISHRLNDTLDFLGNHLQNSSDLYEIAIITYALHLNNHKQKDIAFKKLYSLANKTDDYIHWNRNGSNNEEYTDVEITSYAVQTLLLRNETEMSLAAIRWLISKQNCYGGFSNTQNTVIAIETLAKFASNFSSDNVQLNIKIDANKNQSTSLKINSDELTTLREVLLSKKTKSVNITASGTGTATVQLSWKYNVLKPKVSGFIINHVLEEKMNTSFRMKICVHDAQHVKDSGMALVEVMLPSGYIADGEWLHTITSNRVKKTEMKQEKTQIVVYLDELTDEETCVVIAANRMVAVENLKPAPISVYDYYNNSKMTTVFYTL